MTNLFAPSFAKAFLIFCVLNISTAEADRLLLSENRLQQVVEKYYNNSDAWQHLESRVDASFGKIPYGAGEFAAASALAFHITANEEYLSNAIRLHESAFHSSPDIGWEQFKSKNLFRIYGRWAMLSYDWIKDSLPPNKRVLFEDNFAVWAQYWLEHIDYQNNYDKLRKSDTDHVTSLSETMLWLGLVLSQSVNHKELGNSAIVASDDLLNNFVVGEYMKKIMAGGVWAEGSDYGFQTQVHWAMAFLLNSEHRNIAPPINYAEPALQALNYMTLLTFNDVYKFGSEQANYTDTPLRNNGRYEFALVAQALVSDEVRDEFFSTWWEQMVDSEGHSTSSINTGIWRLLFEPSTDSSEIKMPSLVEKDKLFEANGVGLVAAKYVSTNAKSELFFINRTVRVDHEHQDALGFDFAYNGEWITKEMSGYSGIASTTLAHNSLLIENADNGSSSPTRRPAGDTETLSTYSSDSFFHLVADATSAYNMSGYFATEYAKQVTRQIAFIKPGVVAVYDRVVTDPTAIRDLRKYHPEKLEENASEYLRKVTHVQHLPVEPTLTATNKFRYLTDLNDVEYGVLYPRDAEVELIDESVLWQDAPGYQVPQGQKKWMMKTTNSYRTDNNEFVTYFRVVSNGACIEVACPNTTVPVQDADSTTHITSIDNNSGELLVGNVKGVKVIDVEKGNTVVLWNRDPANPLDYVSIELSDDSFTAHITGLTANHLFRVNVSVDQGKTRLDLESVAPLSDESVTSDFVATGDDGVLSITL